jgi:hypothetical protein
MILKVFCEATGIKEEDIIDWQEDQQYASGNPITIITVSYRDRRNRIWKQFDSRPGGNGHQYTLLQVKIFENALLPKHDWMTCDDGIIRCRECKELKGYANRDKKCLTKHEIEKAECATSVGVSSALGVPANMFTHNNKPAMQAMTYDILQKHIGEFVEQFAPKPPVSDPNKTQSENVDAGVSYYENLRKFLDHKKK